MPTWISVIFSLDKHYKLQVKISMQCLSNLYHYISPMFLLSLAVSQHYGGVNSQYFSDFLTFPFDFRRIGKKLTLGLVQ